MLSPFPNTSKLCMLRSLFYGNIQCEKHLNGTHASVRHTFGAHTSLIPNLNLTLLSNRNPITASLSPNGGQKKKKCVRCVALLLVLRTRGVSNLISPCASNFVYHCHIPNKKTENRLFLAMTFWVNVTVKGPRSPYSRRQTLILLLLQVKPLYVPVI